MGWTSTHKPKYMKLREFFSNQFNFENDNKKSEIIEFSLVKWKTAYAAYKITDKKDNSVMVIALIILIQMNPKSYFNLSYKDMDESMGPYECKCPEKILKLLTPLENNESYAKRWRDDCYKYHLNRKNKLIEVN